MSTSKSKKVIVILGPTASGKTGLAVKLAAEFNGEIVSADSRQVYRGMDIGTGKDLAEYSAKLKVKSQNNTKSNKDVYAEAEKLKVVDIPHHLIDVVDPNEQYDLANYQLHAEAAIEDIISRGKLPILVGGSGLYLQAVVDGYQLSSTEANEKLREELEGVSAVELFTRLKKINSALADKLNASDKHNPRRLVRYLEVAAAGKTERDERPSQGKFECLLIGLEWPKEVLDERIERRLKERLEKEGMVEEVRQLHEGGVSWQRLESFGLEYRYVSRYLKRELNYEEMFKRLFIAIKQFSKKQLTWFRRWERQGKVIHWLNGREEAELLIREFIEK